MQIRPATVADASEIARLLSAYLAESFPDHPGTSAAQLRDEVLANPYGQRVVVAERGAALIGFIAWDRVYDMHWAKSGAHVADLYTGCYNETTDEPVRPERFTVADGKFDGRNDEVESPVNEMMARGLLPALMETGSTGQRSPDGG